MSTTTTRLSAAIATILLTLCVSLAAFAPANAYADEIDLQAAGHGAVRVEDTYKNWVSDLYSYLHYDVTYKVLGYTNGYSCLGTTVVNTWYLQPSPTASWAAIGTVTQYRYLYTTY